MLTGTPLVVFAIYSKAVDVKAVADITLTPFSKTSAVVPFHLMAILQVSVVVAYSAVSVPATLF
jgi:hypothetical protein